METIDSATLHDVVITLREEIQRYACQVKRLQRENRFLVSSILRLQKQRKQQEQEQEQQRQQCHNKIVMNNSGKGSYSQEEGAVNDTFFPKLSTIEPYVNGECDSRHDIVSSSLLLSLPQSSTIPTSTLITSSTRRRDKLGEEIEALTGLSSPNCNDDMCYKDSNTVLQIKFRELEKELQRERRLRHVQAKEYTAELEQLRLALCNAEHPSNRSSSELNVLSQGSPLFYNGGLGEGSNRCEHGSKLAMECDRVVTGSCGHIVPNKEITVHTMKASSLIVKEQTTKDEKEVTARTTNGSEAICNVVSDTTESCCICGSEYPTNVTSTPDFVCLHSEQTSSAPHGCTNLHGSPLTSLDDNCTLTIVSASPSVSNRWPTPSTDLNDVTLEDFLARAASRKEGRQQRLREVVLSRTFVGPNKETSIDHTIPTDNRPNEEMKMRMVTGLSTNTEVMSMSPLPWRRSRHLSSRGTVLSSVVCSKEGLGNIDKSVSSLSPAVSSNALCTTVSLSVVNPNQLGVELDPKGPRDRSWYQHQVLRFSFAKAIYSSSIGSTAHINVDSSEDTSRGVRSELGEKEEQSYPQRPVDRFQSSTETSDSSDTENNVRHSRTEGLLCNTSTPSQIEPLAPVAGNISRSTPLSAVQRAIKEVVRLRFRCSQNQPLLETDDNPFPSTLPPFHKENTDPDLVAAFGTNTVSSNKPRGDEVCIKFYAPVLFSQIRSFLRMDAEGFRASLGENCIWRHTLSPGKSGTSLVYFGNFVLKSVKEGEFKFIREHFLSRYVPFCERNPDTMLPRFFALLSFSWLRSRTCTRYVLMQNVFSTRYYIHRIYDVKGSTVGRSTTTEKAPRTTFGALLLKDNDLPAQLIICGTLQRAHLLAQFRSDTTFLRDLNIVDYSCLIGVRSRVFSRKEGPSKTIVLKERHEGTWRHTVTSEAIGVGEERLLRMGYGCIHGSDGGLLSLPIYTADDDTTAREDVYYIGIIDVLQEYTPAKRLENFAKGLWNDRREISVVPPKEYAERLNKTMDNITV